MSKVTTIDTLEQVFQSTNKVRDNNLAVLAGLCENATDIKDKLAVIKLMNDLLNSKESNLVNIIKTSLLSDDVSSAIDYKQAAIEMLRNVRPDGVAKGVADIAADVDAQLAKRFEDSGDVIHAHETSLED